MTSDASARAWDGLDARLIGLLRSAPNLPVVEMARRLDVARGTVQARLDRLERDGLIVGYGPDLDAATAPASGCSRSRRWRSRRAATPRSSPASTRSPRCSRSTPSPGPATSTCASIARSNEHLHDVLQRILELPGIMRTETQLALHTSIQRTVADLVALP
jgi:DNA-binding Lrp family transcriptional regulator